MSIEEHKRKPGQASLVWGPPLWGFLEALPLLIEEDEADVEIVVLFLYNLQRVLTCKVCREHFGKFLKPYEEGTEDIPKTTEALSSLINAAHNNVNRISNGKSNNELSDVKLIWTDIEHLAAARKSVSLWKLNLFSYMWFPLYHYTNATADATVRWLTSLKIVLYILEQDPAVKSVDDILKAKPLTSERLLNWLDRDFRKALGVKAPTRSVYEAQIEDSIRLGQLLHEKNSQVDKKENVIPSSSPASNNNMAEWQMAANVLSGVPEAKRPFNPVPQAAVVIKGRKIKDQSRVQCACFTAKGTQCLNYAMKGKTKCKIHKNKKVCKGNNRPIAAAIPAAMQPGDMEVKNVDPLSHITDLNRRLVVQRYREQGKCQCYNMDGTKCENKVASGSLNCGVHKHCIAGYSYHSSFGKVYPPKMILAM